MEAIDIKTRKILTTIGNFHQNGSVDRLYMTRKDGGRGLNSVYDVFITRLISLVDHLKPASPGDKYLNLVLQHEETRLVRESNNLMSAICLNETTTHKDKTKTYIKDKHQDKRLLRKPNMDWYTENRKLSWTTVRKTQTVG